MSELKRRARYTLEYKLEAVRLVKGGQASAVTAKILGIPKQTLENRGALAWQGSAQGRR
jgi:transposase